MCGIKNIFFLLFFVSTSFFRVSIAQQLKLGAIVPIDTIKLNFQVELVSDDVLGFIYLSSSNGSVYKLDSLGGVKYLYSPKEKLIPSAIDGNRNLNFLIFYKHFQKYLLLDRFLASSFGVMDLPKENINYAELIALASDQNIWVWDVGDLKLKKMHAVFNTLVYEVSLESILVDTNEEFVLMKEYGNHLFLLGQTGLYKFNDIGIFKGFTPLTEVSELGFDNECIYYLEKDTVVLQSLSKNVSWKYPLPTNIKTKKVLIKRNTLYLITKENELVIFKIYK